MDIFSFKLGCNENSLFIVTLLHVFFLLETGNWKIQGNQRKRKETTKRRNESDTGRKTTKRLARHIARIACK